MELWCAVRWVYMTGFFFFFLLLASGQDESVAQRSGYGGERCSCGEFTAASFYFDPHPFHLPKRKFMCVVYFLGEILTFTSSGIILSCGAPCGVLGS